MQTIRINNKIIGTGYPTYVTAEIGFNHGGNIDLAFKMIEGAAEAGADAVKFQTFKASEIALESAEHSQTIKAGELSFHDHKELSKAAKSNGVDFLSTPFGIESVNLLERLNVPAYKIASMDLTNLPLIKYIASIGKPIILSTGMGILSEISKAVETIQSTNNNNIVLLHCISKYPADAEDACLNYINLLRNTFSMPVGYSDHVLGNTVALAATALGASIIEKHFTIDKSLPGPDHKLSADINDLKNLVQDIKIIEKSLGEKIKTDKRPDRIQIPILRRGLYANIDIPAGTKITHDMIKCVRPAGGLPPEYQEMVINRTAKKDIPKEHPISFEVI